MSHLYSTLLHAHAELLIHLAIHIRDIKSLWSRTLSTESYDGRDFISFRRYQAVTSLIKTVLTHHRPPFDLERYREAGALAYLECNLDALEVTEEFKSELDKRANLLQREEEQSYLQRKREIRDAGFGPRRSSGKSERKSTG